MAGERLVLDPRSESSANAPLELVEVDAADVRGITLLAHDYPAPEPEGTYASSADTEGDPLVQNRYPNREIPLTLRVVEPQDPAATNLVADPSFETASGLWALASGATLTRSTAAARDGDMGLLIAAAASAGSGAVSPAGAAAWSCAASTTYTAAVYVRAAAAADVGKTVQLSLLEVTNAGATVGTTTATIVLTAAWQRLSATRAFGATGVRFQVKVTNASATAFNFHADQVQTIAEASASNYFDGDTPGCSWTGTLGQSTSSRPASGGPRFYAILGDLEKKIDRINREGAVLKRVVPDGSPIMFDLVGASYAPATDRRMMFQRATSIEVTLRARPFGRGATETVGPDNDETTLPALSFTLADVAGDVPALGRLIVTERQGVDQARVLWGLRSRYYDPASTAGLFFEAESRTPGVSPAAVVADGTASGGSVIQSGGALAGYRTILTTQASGGGAHLTHVGTYRVLARVKSSAELADVTFDYAEGDLSRRTETKRIHRTKSTNWELADLGVVRLSRGRWEGRVLMRYPIAAAGTFSVDYLVLVPIAEGAGEAFGGPVQSAPSSYAAIATFGTTAAALSGTVADIGGVFTGGGDADDFSVPSGSGVAQRAATSDSAAVLGVNGRMDWINGLSMGATMVSVDFLSSAVYAGQGQGVAARVASSAAGLMLRYFWNGPPSGTPQVVLTNTSGGSFQVTVPQLVANTWYTITLYVDLQGRVYGWLSPQGAPLGEPIISGVFTSLATGGALAAGSVGIVDTHTGAVAVTRQYDNFLAWSPPADAAVFASRQLEVRSADVRRQDSAGAVWGPVGYEGDYLLVPPAGPEKRTAQVVVKGSRSLANDTGIDDIRGALAYTPRYLSVPG